MRRSADSKAPPTREGPGPDGLKPNDRRILSELAVERKKRQELQSKLQEDRSRDLSEKDKLAKQLEEAKAIAATAQAETLRLRIAAETGLPADLHEFLVGADEARFGRRRRN